MEQHDLRDVERCKHTLQQALNSIRSQLLQEQTRRGELEGQIQHFISQRAKLAEKRQQLQVLEQFVHNIQYKLSTFSIQQRYEYLVNKYHDLM
jgi:hypothetical protein